MMVNRTIFFIFIYLSIFFKCVAMYPNGLSPDTIRYFATATVPQNVTHVIRLPVDTGTTVRGTDTLYQLMNKEDRPVSYYRKILKEICFDGSCRLLNVNLYWNLTGRYFGFELPPNEFLSKAEHTPFTSMEYEQLHGILSDSLSALGSIHYEDLLPKQNLLGQVDAITRPTSKDVLQHVVPGAVFTTYSMWHLVYDQMQEDVCKATEARLSSELLLAIFNSEVPWDWSWGLDRLEFFKQAPATLKQRVLEFVGSDSYGLASKTIDCIPAAWCEEGDFQRQLWSKFEDVEYALRPNLIRRLSANGNLDKTVMFQLAKRLKDFNGPLLNVSLSCLKEYAQSYPEIKSEIEMLAKNKNPYVASQAKKIIQELN